MLKIYDNPSADTWEELTTRPKTDDSIIESGVRNILERVRKGGDRAIYEITREIDGTVPDCLEVSAQEKTQTAREVPDNLKKALDKAADAIRKFHEAQLPDKVSTETSPGVICCQKAVPINRVGLYIPGGRAPLFSTVLMLAIPAKVAGCKDIIVCSPAGKDGKIAAPIIYAATLCGVDRIFKIGGAQAIAAMAYGTESVSKRDKIFGPGNRYVMKAKQAVSVSDVAIDMPAGPSEVMVLADETAVPAFVAADLLSQAEHGPDSQAMLVCNDRSIAEKVSECISAQMKSLPRQDSIISSLSYSRAVILKDRADMISFANRYAPEHLIISLNDPWEAAEKIFAAGSVFIGNYSTESAGDYASGTNHTLPTSGWARSYSGVNIDSFMRKITFQELTRQGLEGIADTIVTMAEAEGLDAHAEAVKIRTNQ